MVTFFNLPPETRNSMYEMSLTSTSPNLNVLTASRQLHEEATSYFYQNNAFTVDLTEPVSDGATILPPIPDTYLRYSRILTINIRLDYVSRPKVSMQAQRLTILAHHCPNLASLTLNFISSASRIVSSTVDDCVLHATHTLTLAFQQLLSSGAKPVRVNLDRVWFAPGVATTLLRDSSGSLEIVTCELSTERAMLGQETRDHLRQLGLSGEDLEDAESHQDLDCVRAFSSLPSSLSSALSELDAFSPMAFLDEEVGDDQEMGRREEMDVSLDEPMFDMDDVEGSEEELTEHDDVDDQEMEHIHDYEVSIDNLVAANHQRVINEDVRYMTNFAPDMLRRLCGQSA